MMTSATGNEKGFTLIEVLLSVSILAVGLAGVMGAYNGVLESYRRARLSIEGIQVLQEKMADQELGIRSGQLAGGSVNGEEGVWSWSTATKPAQQEGWYEIKGEVKGVGRAGTITLHHYVHP